MRPSIGITNLTKSLPHVLVMEFVWRHFHFNAKKYSWFSTITTYMLLIWKGDFRWSLSTLHNHLILCLSTLKSCLINLLKSLSNPNGIYLLEVKNGNTRKSMCEICSGFRGVFRTQSNISAFGCSIFLQKISIIDIFDWVLNR